MNFFNLHFILITNYSFVNCVKIEKNLPEIHSRLSGLSLGGNSLRFISFPVVASHKINSFLPMATTLLFFWPAVVTAMVGTSMVYLTSPPELHPYNLSSYTWRIISPSTANSALQILDCMEGIDFSSFPAWTSHVLTRWSPSLAEMFLDD